MGDKYDEQVKEKMRDLDQARQRVAMEENDILKRKKLVELKEFEVTRLNDENMSLN